MPDAEMLPNPLPAGAATGGSTELLLHWLAEHARYLDVETQAAGAAPLAGRVAEVRTRIREVFGGPQPSVAADVRQTLEARLADAYFELSLVRDTEPDAVNRPHVRRAAVRLRQAARLLDGWVTL